MTVVIILVLVLITILYTGYLQGIEVIDHTSFMYTSRAQSFEWLNRGFKLHLPEGALPPEANECQVHVKASLSGQFQLPEGMYNSKFHMIAK